MREPLRLLFLPQCPLSQERGGSKVQLALAEHLQPLGWQVDCLFPFDPSQPGALELLGQFNVVDWDACHTIDRSLVPGTSLSICRFPLLNLHLAGGVPWPQPLRRRFDPLLDPLRRLRGKSSLRQLDRHWLQQARDALALADAFAVQNSDDRRCLLQQGIPADAILQEPCGLSASEISQLAGCTSADPRAPMLAFVGSFDARKGSADLVWLACQLGLRFPELRLRLIGTNGLLEGETAVRRRFPARLQSRLEVIPSYPAASLAEQLAGVSLGVFPSYLEGFGIAVIEQLAAGIAVLAYGSPGPADILPADWLAPRGDRAALLSRLTTQLEQLRSDPASGPANASRARQIAEPYRWQAIARRWDGHYRRLLAARQAGSTCPSNP